MGEKWGGGYSKACKGGVGGGMKLVLSSYFSSHHSFSFLTWIFKECKL